MAVVTVAVPTCLGRGGGVGACRNCRGHNRGLSDPALELLAVPAPLGPARDDDETPAATVVVPAAIGPDWPAAAGPALASCMRAPSRGLQGAELEPKSLASRVIGSRICERRRADDEPRISSIVPSWFVVARRLYNVASSCPPTSVSLRRILKASGSPCLCFFPPRVVAFFLRGTDSIPTLGEQGLLILAISLLHTLLWSSSIATSVSDLRCNLSKDFSLKKYCRILRVIK